jgi:hypothetical protein
LWLIIIIKNKLSLIQILIIWYTIN